MSLRLAATLLLVGQILYIVVTLFHADGVANDHPAVFAEYAGSAIWTAVHVAQFSSMVILIGGLLALSFALDVQAGTATWASRFGAALAVAALALYGAVLAVDGVALKQAVNVWANAADAEKAVRFASAETIRWLEWGMRSYDNFLLGLALLMFAAAVAGTASLPRTIAYVIGLSGLTYLVQGWLAGSQGFSQTHQTMIVATEVPELGLDDLAARRRLADATLGIDVSWPMKALSGPPSHSSTPPAAGLLACVPLQHCNRD
jgi:hypothetical protein